MGYIWVFPKIGKHPEMDGENNGKPYFLMDDLGGKPTIFGNIQIDIMILFLNGGPPGLRRRIKTSMAESSTFF